MLSVVCNVVLSDGLGCLGRIGRLIWCVLMILFLVSICLVLIGLCVSWVVRLVMLIMRCWLWKWLKLWCCVFLVISSVRIVVIDMLIVRISVRCF